MIEGWDPRESGKSVVLSLQMFLAPLTFMQSALQLSKVNWDASIGLLLFFPFVALPIRHKDQKRQKNNLVATIPHITNLDLFQDSQVKSSHFHTTNVLGEVFVGSLGIL